MAREESNDELDQTAEPLWAIPCERDRESALVANYMPFVRRCVSTAVSDNPNLERDDATQEALIRLVVCIRKFDPARGARFTTYATMPVTFGTLDAARNEDWVPAKARAADRDENKLPVMFPLEATFDTKAREEHLPNVQTDIAEMLAFFTANGIKSVVEDINLALECRFDFEDMAGHMGTSTAHAIYTVKQAFEHARDPEAYLETVRNRPPYTPPEPGSCRVQQRLFDGAA